MKKQVRTKRKAIDRMRAEYDFSGGVRGKHVVQYASGSNVVVLEPDVARQFPTAEDVNETLRTVAKLLGRRRRTAREDLNS